jgi:hypothetical protein
MFIQNKKPIIIFFALIVITILVGVIIYFKIANTSTPEKIQYGVSFNTPYARELGLNWKEVYDAVITELGVKHLRLAAHWDMIEPQNNEWNFSEIDYQIRLAEIHDAEVIFAVGRRLPRWPECHEPEWAEKLAWEDRKEEIKEYIIAVVERYKDSSAITYWQVENEPFLGVFATEHCGGELDVDFLDEEIALVKSLDSSREILITDSGNLGTWSKPYKRGDAFGTSVYVYLWNPDIGPFRSFLAPHFYRFKAGLMELVHGEKETMLIELSAEPWLLQPIVDTSIDIQLSRMNIKKFREIISFAEKTRLEKQYLWGVEWWYYLDQEGVSDFWLEAKDIFRN